MNGTTFLSVWQRLLPVCTTLFFFTLPAWSQTEQSRCAAGQWIITRSVSPARDAKSLAELAHLARAPLELLDTTERTLLLGNSDRPRHAAAIIPEEDEFLCSRVRRHKRARRRAGFITRRSKCDCNAIVFSAAGTDADPLMEKQWALSQSNDIDIDAPQAWEFSRGSRNQLVAVIDTGVDYTHSDLAQNMWRNRREIAGNGVDDDGNGYVDDIHGASTVHPRHQSGDPMDDGGHGTHVAGIIAARANNGIGISGVAPETRIIAVKFLDARGRGTLYGAVRAIDYVTALRMRGEPVVASNNSWGAPGFHMATFYAIRRARRAGLLFVAAAGNGGTDIDATPFYPAAYDFDNIVSVAGTDEAGNLAPYSNSGRRAVHLAAPGSNILSTYPDNRYAYASGTSMAAPHVAGTALLLSSAYPGSDYRFLREHILRGALPRSALRQATSTGGILKARASLLAPCQQMRNRCDIDRNGTVDLRDGQAVRLAYELFNDTNLDPELCRIAAVDVDGDTRLSRADLTSFESACNTADPHTAFITRTSYPSNLGGLSGADATCQSAARTAQLAGTFRAILSDSQTHARDRIKINAPVHDLWGRRLAENTDDFWDGELAYPLEVNEKRRRIDGMVWTGTDSDGQRDRGEGTNWCHDWYGDSGLSGVEIGRTNDIRTPHGLVDINWLAAFGDTTRLAGGACKASMRLYCISQ